MNSSAVAMVLTAEDIAAISHIVAATLAQMPMPTPKPAAVRLDAHKKVRGIDERYYTRSID